MGVFRRVLVGALALGIASAIVPAAAAVQPTGSLVSIIPAAGTPHVLDGRVNSIVRLGGAVILGGQFSQAREDDSATILARANLLAFDETTYRISTTFLPVTNGPVSVVLAAPDGQSVYIGGSFTTVNGVTAKNLARVRLSDGSLMTTFNPATVAGPVKDLKLAGGRLWVGGAFTHIAGKRQPALATIDPNTGKFLPFMLGAIAGTHNGGWTTVMKFDITPDGSRLVAIGNFDTYDGVKTHQAFMLDLTGSAATRAPWQTAFYETMCASAFDTYMRDLDFAPDGSFFVISTTGAYGGSSVACDSTARFDTSVSGSGLAPSWINHTGGDTTYAVEITDTVVYTGGHARWQNNSFAADTPGPGAVSRPGIAALDPINGLPFTWNPTRDRGVGVFDFVATDNGLWVASDTNRIGASYLRSRIALLPAAGGTSFDVLSTPGLPNDLYRVTGSGLTKRWSTTASFGPDSSAPSGGIAWSSVKGAFMLDGYLYLAWSDGRFDRRTFDGTAYGPAESVATHNELNTLSDWTSDIQNMTGLFYDNGRLYFTRSGSGSLFYRYFTPENKLVGARRLTASGAVSGFSPSAVRSMFLAEGKLYWADVWGDLRSIAWSRTPQAGVPTGTSSVIGGFWYDGQDWSARAFFLYQDADGDNALLSGPEADFTSSCTSLDCGFDAAASNPNGATITAYAWTFGDGASSTQAAPTHTYAASGSYPVTLTVTTNKGTTDSVTKTVAVTRINGAPTAAFSQACNATTCTMDAGVSSDPDGTITDYAWDFGDGSSATGVTTSHPYAADGTYSVTLTVTDNDGASASSTQQVSVTSAAVQFVGAASTNGNRLTHSVRIPASVQAGDVLVLIATLNSSTAAPTAPVGWTLVETKDSGGLVGQVYTKTAAVADAGALVSFSTAAYVKSDLSVAAYRMSDGSASALVASSGAVRTTTGTSVTTPTVAVASSRAWLVSYWAVKTSTTLTITAPAGQVVRAGMVGTGSGAVGASLADGDGAVPSGTAGGLTANTSASVSRAVSFSLVIAPLGV